MGDFESKLLAEEADLERKLAAVRAMKAAYGIGGKAVAVARSATVKSTTATAGGARSARNATDRMDKFGSYGQHIIDTACKLLPGEGMTPTPTRTLVEHFATLGVEVRGENKVNALSALLARSSKIKGYGRAGWTLAGPAPGELYPQALEGGGFRIPNEKEPNSEDAVGSKPAEWGAPTPSPAPSPSSSGWPS